MPGHHSTTARGAPPPRTTAAPQRRRELLDAGIEMFTTKGVATATVDQITRAAGVAKGTFYLHFETKEHLLAALQRDVETRLVARLDATVAGAGDDPHDRLLAWIDAAFTHYPDDLTLHEVLFHHPIVTPAAGAAAGPPEHRTQVASLADVVEAGRNAGAFDVADVETTAMLLGNALHLMFGRIRHRDEQDRIRAAVRQMFERTLGAG